jgi:hypothetical protein
MVASHYAYNMIKIPATCGVLTIRADIRDAVFCVTKMDKAAAAGEPGNLSEAMLEDTDPGSSSVKKHFPMSRLPWCARMSALHSARASSWERLS